MQLGRFNSNILRKVLLGGGMLLKSFSRAFCYQQNLVWKLHTSFHHSELDLSYCDNNVWRVFDITDVSAIVLKLEVCNTDRCIFLVQVSCPADSVLKLHILPRICPPIRIVEKLQSGKQLSCNVKNFLLPHCTANSVELFQYSRKLVCWKAGI